MLHRFRHSAPIVSALLCLALLATWLSGAHEHRLPGDHQHQAQASSLSAAHSAHEHAHAIAQFAPHPLSLIHSDGHEDVEQQAVQPPGSKLLPEFALLVLPFCVLSILVRARILLVAAIADPPDLGPAVWSLRPPLRGPPSYSVL